MPTKIQEIELILHQMRQGGFDFDGVDPDTAIEELKEEIDRLMQEREKIEYLCNDCSAIISEDESNMFSGLCETCNDRI